MGGTTAKVGLIQHGIPLTTSEYSVGGPTHGRAMGASATGYPIRVPVLDLVEVGTGGGSIAYLDESGGLHVGPLSAGAEPGPMCYGRGGDQPTVTDAHVVTGVIDPDNFLGGRMKLDPDQAFKGIERIARKINLSVMETAKGIIDIADAAMLVALRVMSVERGIDPREVAMLAFGGAGPMRAAALGASLGVKTVVIPPEPGLFSALGLLITDVRHDEVRSVIQDLRRVSFHDLASSMDQMITNVDGSLAREGFFDSQRQLSCALDLRYRGQSYELSVSIPADTVTQASLDRAATTFHDMHETRYGYANRAAPIQLVAIRVSGVGKLPMVMMNPQEPSGPSPEHASTGHREVYLSRAGSARVQVFDRSRLLSGNVIKGPAIFEQFDSTILVQANQTATVDSFLNLVISTES